MKHVIEELEKSLQYHYRQFNENQRKITFYHEALKDLEERNKTHGKAMVEIEKHLNELEKD